MASNPQKNENESALTFGIRFAFPVYLNVDDIQPFLTALMASGKTHNPYALTQQFDYLIRRERLGEKCVEVYPKSLNTPPLPLPTPVIERRPCVTMMVTEEMPADDFVWQEEVPPSTATEARQLLLEESETPYETMINWFGELGNLSTNCLIIDNETFSLHDCEKAHDKLLLLAHQTGILEQRSKSLNPYSVDYLNESTQLPPQSRSPDAMVATS